jgi:hypothetical protein
VNGEAMSISIDYARKYRDVHRRLEDETQDELGMIEWKLTQLAARLSEITRPAYARQFLRDTGDQLGGQ